MIRTVDMILCLSFLSLTVGFGIPRSLRLRTGETRLMQETTSWSDYKHDYVDPITKHASPSYLEDHMDPARRKISDEYWLSFYEQEKEKLQLMEGDASPTVIPKESNSWPRYKKEYIDPITPHDTAVNLYDHMNPSKKARADEYWLHKFLEDKEKLHNKKIIE